MASNYRSIFVVITHSAASILMEFKHKVSGRGVFFSKYSGLLARLRYRFLAGMLKAKMCLI